MPSKTEYWRNPEKHRAATRAYYQARPDQKRENDRRYMRRKRAGMSAEERKNYEHAQKKNNPQGYMWKRAQIRARQFGIPFDLRPEDIIIPDVCPVFGVPFQWGRGQMGWRNMWSPSLDKIKPELGYVQGNVMVISNRANHLKSNGSIAEFEAVLAYMRRVGAHYYRLESEETVLTMASPSPQLSFSMFDD